MIDLSAVPGPSVDSTPSPSHYPYFGVTPNSASWAAMGFSSYADAVIWWDNEFGGMPMFRTFNSGNIGTWASGYVNTVTTNTNATVHHSFKTWNATEITAWMNAKPDNGLDAFLTYHHEPENDGWNAAQILDWQQKCSQLIDLRNATGRTDIKCGPTLMGNWTLKPQSGRDYWRDWYVGPPIPGYTPVGYPTDLNEQDFLGWDPYNESSTGYQDPKTVILDESTYSLVNIHRITGRPCVIGEYGSDRKSFDTDGTALAAWVTAYHQAAVDFYSNEGIKFLSVSYWSDAFSPYLGGSNLIGHPSGDPPSTDEPLARAAMLPFMAASRNFYGISGG